MRSIADDGQAPDRDARSHDAALTGVALKVEPAVHEAEPLAHAGEADATVGGGTVKPFAVVAYGELDLATVLDRVGDAAPSRVSRRR